MGPKIEAAVEFLEGGGRSATICRIEDAVPILEGMTGPQIVSDAPYEAVKKDPAVA
jgi:carbamate kinase